MSEATLTLDELMEMGRKPFAWPLGTRLALIALARRALEQDDIFSAESIAQSERDQERFEAGWTAGRQFDVRRLIHPHVEPDEVDDDPPQDSAIIAAQGRVIASLLHYKNVDETFADYVAAQERSDSAMAELENVLAENIVEGHARKDALIAAQDRVIKELLECNKVHATFADHVAAQGRAEAALAELEKVKR